MRKINLIMDKNNELMAHPLRGVYGVDTLTRSVTIGNLSDLISDLDRLVEVGYSDYLNEKKVEFSTLEELINDTMHLRNLFTMGESDMKALTSVEREAYVRRADLKVEVQFVETNEQYMTSLVNIMKKINKFNEKKNTRIYTPKKLTKFNYIMEEN